MVIQKRNNDTETEQLSARALFKIDSFDDKTNTVTITMTTENPVRMFNWELGYFMEILNCDKASIKANRLNNGLPVLDNHNRYESVKDTQVGIVESWEASNGKLTGTVRFSARPSLADFINDVKDGIIRNVSVGYRVLKYQVDTPPTDTTEGVYRAIEWEPMEVSFVQVGADMDATTRSNENSKVKNTFIIVDENKEQIQTKNLNSKTSVMPTEIEIKNAERQRCIAIHNAVKAAGLDAGEAIKLIDAERTIEEANADIAELIRLKTGAAEASKKLTEEEVLARNVAIKDAVKSGGFDDAFALELITKGVSLENARTQIIAKWAENDPNKGATNVVKVTVDDEDKLRPRMEDALLLRSGAVGIEFTPERKAAAKEFMGRRMTTVVRMYFQHKGIDTNMLSDIEVAKKALSDSDFPNILANTIGRSLRAAYQLAPRTFTNWARQVSAPDFRPMNRTQLSGLLRGFEQIHPGGEYKESYMTDSKEQIAVIKYGEKIGINWESIINDDMSAFSRLPQAFAENAAYKQSDLVYAILLGNPAMLTDNVALFHANHANLVASGTDIDATSMGVMRQKLREQTAPGNKILNLDAGFIIAGPKKETKVLQYTSADYLPNTQAEINPWKQLQPIIEGRITGNTWFMLAGAGRIDTVEFAFLEGEQELYTESWFDRDNDSFVTKGRMVFGAAPIDYRGMVKNPGA